MINKMVDVTIKAINWLFSFTSDKCQYCSKCKYYDGTSYTCNEDNGCGCGVCRDWKIRKDGRKNVR